MKKRYLVTSSIVIAASLLCHALLFDAAESTAAAKKTAGEKTLAAARALVESLGEEEREKALFEFDSPERFNWHFIPRERKGLSLKAVSAATKQKMQDLVRASISQVGYKRAELVRELEAILAELEGPNRRFSRDPELYFVSIFGKPSAEGKWGWRYEGHHLSLNFTLQGGEIIASTPFMYGANPAEVQSGDHKGLRALGELQDAVLAFAGSVTDEQKPEILGQGPTLEVQDTTRAQYESKLPPGLPFRKLAKEQKQKLRKLLREYLRNLAPSEAAELRRAIRDAGTGKLQIAWRGSLDLSEKHSFLIHSPAIIVSYVNDQNNVNHIHAACRTNGSDFGK